MVKDAEAQDFKLDNGVVFSSYHNRKDLSILSSEKLVTYSALLGVDYLDKERFYLSSQLGYLR